MDDLLQLKMDETAVKTGANWGKPLVDAGRGAIVVSILAVVGISTTKSQ